MQLDNLALFLQIVEKGGLAAGGREVGLSPTTVSERLAALEAHFGVTLLNRTTRAISLTEEGRLLMDGAKRILAETEELDSRIRFGAQTLSGLIRISAPIDLGHTMIVPVVDAFLTAHPTVAVELVLSDSYINIVDEGIDIAIRFGNLADSSLRVRSLGEHRRVVCASPSYVQVHGVPKSPLDLQQHNCLVMRFGAHLDNTWRFRIDRKDQSVIVDGNRIANDSGLVHTWCIAGRGIAFKSQLDIGADLESGALVALLEKFTSEPIPIQMLFPPSRAQPHRVRELSTKISEAFSK